MSTEPEGIAQSGIFSVCLHFILDMVIIFLHIYFQSSNFDFWALFCRRDVPLQKQAASSSANHELVHPQRKPIDRSRSHNVARFKVLADVDGNSPRASANHDKVQQEGVCPPGTPDITPFSRLRRTASGV